MEKPGFLRRIAFGALCFAGLATYASVPRVATTPRGDANLDYAVNVSDVTTVVDSLLCGSFAYWCDANQDGVLNTSDVTEIINIILSGDEVAPSPTYSGTLPTLFINTENHWSVLTKENYLMAGIYIVNPDGTMHASAEAPQEVKIKGRGNSTWADCPKKPYKLKFLEKTALLGMPKNKEFTLLPHFLDWWGYQQNTIGFRLSERMGLPYTPRQQPVELVLNGAYIGLYFLTEQINVDKNRVNIAKQDDGETDAEKITGGWLIEIENYPEEESILIHENDDRQKQNLYFTCKAPEELSPAQLNYIKRYLKRTDFEIYDGAPNDTTWERYIDMESLAKFYIVNEIVDNKEAFSGSCYMSKDRGADTKLTFGPVWDFGSSFCAWEAGSDSCFHSFIYEHLPHYANSHWIGKIAQYTRFQQKVRELWKQFYENEYQGILDYADAFALSIKEAAAADFARWPSGRSGSVVARKDQFYIPSLKAKVAWLQQQWGAPTP
ncbi:MAG: CotH kinase family protein [Bacteroidales bacterium]|nr:CotH kinase family protein [Bacteroidales bacterium]